MNTQRCVKKRGVKLCERVNDELARAVYEHLHDELFDDDFLANAVQSVIDEQKLKLAQVFDARIKALDFAQLPTSAVLDSVFRQYRARKEFKMTKIEYFIQKKQLSRVEGIIVDYAVRKLAEELFDYETSVRLLTRDFASEVDVLDDELVNIEIKTSKSVYDEALVELAIQRVMLNELNNVRLRKSKALLVNVDFLNKRLDVRSFDVVFSDDYLNALHVKMNRAVRVRDALLEAQSVVTRIMRNMHFSRLLEANRVHTSLYRFYKRVREFADNERVRIDVLDFAREQFIISRA